MEENNGGSSSLPPFLTKTYEMVDDSSSDSVVSWSHNNQSFIVKNPTQFSTDLLPRFFKHKNFSSFIRQLNTYGFRKIDPEKWEFANDDFVRGQPYLMKNIYRRKPVHSHSLQNLQAQNPLTESERQSMKDQIDRLQREKEVLLADLRNQEQERMEFELQLTNRLQHIEQRQESIVSFVSKVLEKPSLSLNIETHHRRKRRLQETSLTPSRPNAEQIEKVESSLTFWENLVTESCEKSGVQSSSMDLDVNESARCADSLSSDDTRPESTKIDMNSEPVTAAAAPKTGVNDDFWEQYFTENPGSTEQQEVQSERRDVDARNGENDNGNKIGGRRTFWWNLRNVNAITEKT